jgi:hypothetical protein
VLLVFERKIFRSIYDPKYKNGEWKTKTNRELEEMNKGKKYSKMEKGTKNKLARSPGENGGK